MTFPGILNQDAVWHKSIGEKNAYNEPTLTPTPIKVRWEESRRMVMNRKGENVQSQALVTCFEDIQERDYLEYNGRKWPIISVDEPPDVNGKVTIREVYV